MLYVYENKYTSMVRDYTGKQAHKDKYAVITMT